MMVARPDFSGMIATAIMATAALGLRAEHADREDQQGHSDDAESDDGLPVGHESGV